MELPRYKPFYPSSSCAAIFLGISPFLLSYYKDSTNPQIPY
nr:MAG TPA: hypothetical protein [Caudoviricetes sp.]